MPRTPHHRVDLLPCRHPGIEAVAADTAFAFGRHMHAQFGVGLIQRGAQKSASGRGMVEAGPGDLITVNPCEVHDGAPIGDGGRAWRMLYIDPAMLARVAQGLGQESAPPCLEFARPALSNPELARCFGRLFEAMTCTRTGGTDDLAADEALVLLLGGLLHPGASAVARSPSGIARARSLIDDDPSASPGLDSLAAQAGLSPYQFLRAFARATGLTPHAYLLQRRTHRARQLIGQGVPLAQAATDSGFYDQSHMSRFFVRSFGMPPGRYAEARRR
ncbi:AraC family transcriptional regulator [Paracidovorax avenae]|uniref:AraC family transcriptional regulator n=1 Tax=Paracidovorax avenae TaxID=80867 RepID=UPI000D216560|nr:AraC family transcriptional regulator [Paracidovorax avenae]AVS86144.1 AraC family transcriptional regulator [Paracidovorax avenae]